MVLGFCRLGVVLACALHALFISKRSSKLSTRSAHLLADLRAECRERVKSEHMLAHLLADGDIGAHVARLRASSGMLRATVEKGKFTCSTEITDHKLLDYASLLDH
eukprot:546704-Rhodomonas_salina.1